MPINFHSDAILRKTSLIKAYLDMELQKELREEGEK